jgi:hypothetical protein
VLEENPMTNDRRTQICFFTFLMTLAVCFASVLPAHSQENETSYIEIDYMKVNRASQVEYVKLEKEIWKPIHQERVSAGKIVGWYLYRVSYPGGTEVHHNYTTVTVYRTFKDMENSYPLETWRKVHPNLSTTDLWRKTGNARDLVRSEVWRRLDYVRPEQTSAAPAPIAVVNYMKTKPGQGNTYASMSREIWKPIMQKRLEDGNSAGWDLYVLRFPGGTSYEYNYGTVNFHDKFEQLEGFDLEGTIKRAHAGKDFSELMRRTREARDLVLREVWNLVDYVQAQ